MQIIDEMHIGAQIADFVNKLHSVNIGFEFLEVTTCYICQRDPINCGFIACRAKQIKTYDS